MARADTGRPQRRVCDGPSERVCVLDCGGGDGKKQIIDLRDVWEIHLVGLADGGSGGTERWRSEGDSQASSMSPFPARWCHLLSWEQPGDAPV